MIWVKPKTNNHVSLKSLIQSKALTFFNSTEAGDVIKLQKKSLKLKARRGWFMRFKGRSCLYYIKVQDQAARADVESAASYSIDETKILNEGGYTNNRFQCRQDTLTLEEDAI